MMHFIDTIIESKYPLFFMIMFIYVVANTILYKLHHSNKKRDTHQRRTVRDPQKLKIIYELLYKVLFAILPGAILEYLDILNFNVDFVICSSILSVV